MSSLLHSLLHIMETLVFITLLFFFIFLLSFVVFFNPELFFHWVKLLHSYSMEWTNCITAFVNKWVGPKISFTGAGALQESGLIPVRLLRHFPRLRLLKLLSTLKLVNICTWMQAETAVGDSFTTQVIGEILNKSVAASEGPGHELCSPCVVTSITY